MDHIQARCDNPSRVQIWKLMNTLWTKRNNTPFEPSAGLIMGCGLSNYTHEDKPIAGKNRLFRILVSESAFLIWKLRNERIITDRTHSPTEVHNRWVGTINKRLAEDCILTDTRSFEKKAIAAQLVQHTWHKCLLDEASLPSDWHKQTGVLVGIVTKGYDPP